MGRYRKPRSSEARHKILAATTALETRLAPWPLYMIREARQPYPLYNISPKASRACLKRPDNILDVLAGTWYFPKNIQLSLPSHLHVSPHPFLLFLHHSPISSSSSPSIRLPKSKPSLPNPACETGPHPPLQPQHHHQSTLPTLHPEHHQRNRTPLLPRGPALPPHSPLRLPHSPLHPSRLPQRHDPPPLGPQFRPPRRARVPNLLYNPRPRFSRF